MSRRLEKLQKREKQQRDADLRWLLDDARGRRIVWRLLQDNHYAEPIFNGNSRDAMVIGRQAAATEFLRDLKAIDINLVHRMEIEAMDAQKLAQQSAEADAGDDDADDI